MRATVVRSLAVVGVGAVLLAGVLYVASTVDGRAPSVVSIALTQPVPDESLVGLPTTSLEITFTEPVETDSAIAALAFEPPIEGSVSVAGSAVLFTPSEPLELAATYTLTVAAGVRDAAGNRMTEVPPPFTFETTGPPQVVETDPPDGATGVLLDAPVSIRFSGLMDTASVEAALRLRPIFDHTLRWSGRLLEIVPTEALRPDTDYRVDIGAEALDTSGVALGEPVRMAFHTLTAGLDVTRVVPRDGTDGVAAISSIAVIFDDPVDPASVSGDAMSIRPDVSGSLEIVDVRGETPASGEEGVVLRFVPAGPLPPNTTFDVRLEPTVAGIDGGGLAEPLTWSFTTGAPGTALTNQVAFLSDRAGIANLWVMNPDGSGAHQVSAELSPVLDYAIAPDGSSFVVGDGHRLVMQDADGSDRRVITDDGYLEFDPTYAPNGQHLAFARVDATDGGGLGIWQRSIPGDDVSAIDLPSQGEPDSGDVPHRAPRYSPDGTALAFVDATGWVAIVGLDDGTFDRARFAADVVPSWLPDSSAVVLTGRPSSVGTEPEPVVAPVEPMAAGEGTTVAVLRRDASRTDPSGLDPGAVLLALGSDGRIAYRDADGGLWVSDSVDEPGRRVPRVDEPGISGVAFSPNADEMVVIIPGADREPTIEGTVVRVGMDNGRRQVLANDGWRARWLP